MLNPKFEVLWQRMVSVATETEQTRLLSVLKNHSDNKEYIMRKLGIVSENDVKRLVKFRASKQ